MSAESTTNAALIAELQELRVRNAELEARDAERAGIEEALRQAEERSNFLAAASVLLASSLDYQATLSNVAQLTVPHIADYCAVDMVDADGSYRRLAIAHIDPAKVAYGWEIERRYGFDPDLPQGAAKIMRTGQPELYPEISDELLALIAHDEEHLRLLQGLGLRSGMIVALIARGRTLGALSFGQAESGRRFGPKDLQLAEDLAQRAAVAIDNARLYAEAQAAVRLRDEFLTIAAHEIRTPMASLMGYTELLQRRNMRDEVVGVRDQATIDVVAQQANRLSKLVGVLLDVSRLQTGLFTLDRRVVELAALARRAVDEAEHTFPPGVIQHTIRLHCQDQPLYVEGDAFRLEQVLQNLLQNAIKYSPNGGTIAVRVEQRDQEAVLSVTDEGIGIPQEAQAQLFRRFYRAPNTVGSSISGMGIGLYVVDEIVRRHGGSVSVTSAEGRGSVFTIHLPLLSADRRQEGAALANSSSMAPGTNGAP